MRNLFFLLLPVLVELVACITIPHATPYRLPIDGEENNSIHSTSEIFQSQRQPGQCQKETCDSWSQALRNKFVEKVFGRRPKSSQRFGKKGHVHPHQQQQVLLENTDEVRAPPLSLFDNDVVLRFNVSTVLEARALAEATETLFLDVWSTTRDYVDIRMDRSAVKNLLNLLPDSLQDAHAPLMHDLGATVRETFPGAPNRFLTHLSEQKTSSGGDIFFNDYQPLSVINPWMKLLESLFPSHVSTFSIGSSYEGRNITGLKISSAKETSTNQNLKRKAIIITGAAHAREWISVSTVCYLAYSFVTQYSLDGSTAGDSVITELVDNFDWYFIPTLNVDGYAYTWEEDRLWRKNRQPTSVSFCKGIEIDRNYGFKFGAQVLNNPCSENYPGKRAFEAYETKYFANWTDALTNEGNTQIEGFLDFHSYSQQILYPYSYTCDEQPPDLENLEELAIGMSKAARVRHGEHYQISSACEGGGWFSGTTHPPKEEEDETPYKQKSDTRRFFKHQIMESGAGGSALDYFYSMEVPYSYQIKLRDTGSYGFLLPSANIRPTGEESASMVRYFGQFILGNRQ